MDLNTHPPTDSEVMLAAVALLNGSDKTPEALILEWRQAAQNMADVVVARADARKHAEACLRACDGWTVETLGHNIESSFSDDLDGDECDDIARAALGAQQ